MEKKQSRNNIANNSLSLIKTTLFDIGITNAKENKILEFVLHAIENTNKKLFIVTPNPEIIVYAAKHRKYTSILNSAEIALCDGVGLFISSRFLGTPIQQRITGVHFMEALCEQVSKKSVTVGFLGGRNGVAQLTADRLLGKYPELKVAFVGEESDELFNFQNIDRLKLDTEKSKNIDILFVAFGFPKQEEWMFENIGKLDVRMMMGVGGSFDYLSGQVYRAPKFIQAVGFEWLYRLIRQPRRWKRQLALIEFLKMVFREKFNKWLENVNGEE